MPLSLIESPPHTHTKQVAARRWIRNGDDMVSIEFFYQNWREYLLEPDVLLLMTALAAGPPEVFLADVMQAFGGRQMLREAGEDGVAKPLCVTP